MASAILILAPAAPCLAASRPLAALLSTTPADSLGGPLARLEASAAEPLSGAEAALTLGALHFARGEYRFVAEAMGHVVFADPAKAEARQLGADSLEQLGYAAESATWRNAYLLGALELRHGVPTTGARAPVSPDVVRAMSLDLFFDYLGVRLNGEKAEGRRLVVNWVFSDLDRGYVANLENSALTCLADRRSDVADATVTLERAALNRLVLREMTFADAVERGLVRVEGDAAKAAELFGLLDDFSLMFEVLEPKRESRAAPARPGS